MIQQEEAAYMLLRQRVLEATGIDISAYKRQQMERRLKALLDRSRVSSYYAYAKLIEGDPEKARELWDFITINVSEFFRNPDRFVELEAKIIPLLHKGKPLRVWSAGCSNGAEPYSLAMILDEAVENGYSIIATDIDRKTLARAREGLYDPSDLKNVSPSRMMKYFEAREGKFAVVENIRKHVKFMYHDLLSDPFMTDLDLIVCRNVIIYFTEEAKENVFRGFARALKPGGVLFLGETETIFNSRAFGFEPISPFFYKRI